jgi:ribosomal protein S18 acetylase RimI-like enzyme
MQVRGYRPSDYKQLKTLYLDGSTFGGQFAEARDAAERLQKKIEADPDAILVAEIGGKIMGTVSLIDDGRVAWLFRFAVPHNRQDIAKALYDTAIAVLRQRGHSQVQIYAPAGNEQLNRRYEALGFTKGNDYTCYWKDI